MVLNVPRNHKAYYGREEWGGEMGYGGGRRGKIIVCLSLQCHHQNDSICIMMGNDESHFNVSLIVRAGTN